MTSLNVSLENEVDVVLPNTPLDLRISKGFYRTSNISSLPLVNFDCKESHMLTLKEVDSLPKTLKKISITVDPSFVPSVVKQMFPQLE